MLADVSERERRLCPGFALVIHLQLRLPGVGRCPRGTARLDGPLSRSTTSAEKTGWLAGCPLAACGAKCYYTGVTAALCAETGLQHSLEITEENTEAVCNDFHSEGRINAYGSNCLG